MNTGFLSIRRILTRRCSGPSGRLGRSEHSTRPTAPQPTPWDGLAFRGATEGRSPEAPRCQPRKPKRCAALTFTSQLHVDLGLAHEGTGVPVKPESIGPRSLMPEARTRLGANPKVRPLGLTWVRCARHFTDQQVTPYMTRKSSIPVINHRAPTKQQANALAAMRAFALERKARVAAAAETKAARRADADLKKPPKPRPHALDPLYFVEKAGGIVMVPLDGQPDLKVRIREADYIRLTNRQGIYLTRSRWYLDDGMVRAMSRKEKPRMTEGLLVAALLCDAQEGDLLKIEDPLILFPETIERFVAA